MRKAPPPNRIMRKYLLLIFYVVASTLIGKEFHPFSQFPMYNSFPNYSYVLFLKNEKGDIIPFGKYFPRQKYAGQVAHVFYSYFTYHGYSCGYGKEDPVHLHQAGKEITEMLLKDEDPRKFDFDTLNLYRRFYYLADDRINYRDDLIYEQGIKR